MFSGLVFMGKKSGLAIYPASICFPIFCNNELIATVNVTMAGIEHFVTLHFVKPMLAIGFV